MQECAYGEFTTIRGKELDYALYNDALIKYYSGREFWNFGFSSFIKTMRIICTKKEEKKYTINNKLLAPKRIILVAYL